MSNYQRFIFKRYQFDKSSGILKLYYGYDESLDFCETYHFAFSYAHYNEPALDRAFQLLFLMAGVSYYKLFLAPNIIVENAQIDSELSNFLAKTYNHGLGEFFYVNQLDPKTAINFPVTSSELSAIELPGTVGQLIGLGGGKDSLVTTELLRDQPKIATWSLNHRSQLEPLVNKVGLQHFWVAREWDQQLGKLDRLGALNGHVPISAILSCVGNIVGILTGYRDLIVSNESSASEPTLNYQGVDINHQYSKSLEYEKDFQACLQHLFGNGMSYYSFLRPFSELRIAELFAHLGFDKYLGVFSSCNRAYRHGEHQMFWCGECAKCAFVCLIMTPFVESYRLLSLWGGKNLLLEPSLDKTYRKLLGIEGTKPLDCVGEVKEARAAMQLAKKQFPELEKYKFDLPSDYDYRAWSSHAMPQEEYKLLKTKVLV